MVSSQVIEDAEIAGDDRFSLAVADDHEIRLLPPHFDVLLVSFTSASQS